MRLDTKLLAAFCAVALPLSWAVTVSARKAVHEVLVSELESAAAADLPGAVGSLRIGLTAEDGQALKNYVAGCIQGFRAAYAAAYGPSGEPKGHTLPGPQASLESGRQAELSQASAPVIQERMLAGALILEYAVPVRSPQDRYMGALILRFPLAHVLATESLIARRVLAFSGTFVAAALILLWVMTRRMIAELRQKEAKLAQTEKLSLVGQLAAGIAHEINNPLGSILGFAQAAALRLKGDGTAGRALGRHRGGGSALPQAGPGPAGLLAPGAVPLEDIDLNEVVGSVLSMVAAQARLNSVTVASEPGLRQRVRADRGQIQQIVVNLCGNALDAMPQGGRLVVRTRLVRGTQRNQAVFEVEDTGPGVPPELRSRIFEPFFTTKESGHGTGLGLALVQQIVRRHDGAISVSSQPGQGALFTVSLPLSGAGAA